MADSDKIRIISNIASFADVTKSLQEVEKALNGIVDSIKTPAEKELKETEGSTGDIQITQNADKSYTFEIRTEEGWKTPVIGNNAIKFKNKPAESSKNQDKSIDEIEVDDTSTGNSTAKKTIYDEKADKFVLARPDYDSGWIQDATADAAITVEHNLDIINFSLIDLQISNSSTGANATWLSITDADEGGYIIQVKDSNNIFVGTDDAGPPRFDCAGLTWEDEVSTHFRLRLWK